MSEILTMEEIERKFDGEWVLIEDVETDERLEVVRGKVAYHGNDQTELHRQAMKSKTKRFASLFIGKPDPKMEFLLGFEKA
jgi:hypothetical protein